MLNLVSKLTNFKKNMNSISIIFAFVTFLSAGYSCTGKVPAAKNDPLPDSMPQDIAFQYVLSGGMLYYSESIYISKDSCYLEINDEGKISKTYFNLSNDEINSLYKTFKDNEFDRISTRETMIYDRGGVDISLYWENGKHINVSNSGLSFVDKSWIENWNKCTNALLEVSSNESEKKMKNYEIRIDRSLYDRKLVLGMRNKTILKDSSLTSANDFIPIIVRLSHGTSRLTLGTSYSYFGEFAVNPDSSSAIRLYLKNDTLHTQYIR